MNKSIGLTFKLSLASIAMLASMGAHAVSISNPVLTGTYVVNEQTSPGLVTPVAANLADVNAVLVDGVGGNVKLAGGFTDATVTTLSGNLGSNTVLLSSLTLGDWTADSNALAASYITGAANSISTPLTPAQLSAAVTYFITHSAVWQGASDANIAAVNLINGKVIVSQDGFLNASAVLNALFGGAAVAPATAQASEVVKVTYNGVTEYDYSFSAIPTGYATANGVNYTGRYNAVPEPGILALIVSGFAGLAFTRRRAALSQ